MLCHGINSVLRIILDNNIFILEYEIHCIFSSLIKVIEPENRLIYQLNPLGELNKDMAVIHKRWR